MKRLVGMGLILLGMFSNATILGWLLLEDGYLHSPSARMIILIVQILMVVLGISVLADIINLRYLSPRWWWEYKKGEFLLLFCMIILSIFVLEGTMRYVYATSNHLPYNFSPEQMIYPELYTELIDYDSNDTNVLLLGGSVLNFASPWLNTSKYHYYDVARPGHTSLDSLHKINHLIARGYDFDYVVFYHGINEVRANNVPANLFRDDYSHYSFYATTNEVFSSRYPLRVRSVLLYRLYQQWYTFYTRSIFNEKFVPTHGPRLQWLPYGSNIKTRAAFEENVQKIAYLVQTMDAPLLVPIFAKHLAANYSLEAFLSVSLGYDNRTQMFPVELWGLPENVLKGIEVHNAVLRKNGDQYILINTDTISSDITNFFDIVHFSDQGNQQFAEILESTLAHSKS